MIYHLCASVEVLIEEGLSGYKDHPYKIHFAALSTYAQTDPEFQLKFQEFSARCQALMMKIMKRDPNIEKEFEDFAKDI